MRNEQDAGALGEWGIVVLFLAAFLAYIALQLPAVASAWADLRALLG